MSGADWLPELCLQGLERMYLPESRRFSSRYLVDEERNESEPASELRYTLNTLLGLAQYREAGGSVPWKLEELYASASAGDAERHLGPANTGMSLWVAAALGLEPPAPVRERARAWVSPGADRKDWTTQDFGWFASGLAAARSDERLDAARRVLRDAEASLRVESTGLFRYSARSLRRNQSSFGGVAYLTHAYLHLASRCDDAWAREVGLRACEALVALQGPRGEWPWLIDVERGAVSDWYPVYSVHQDAMAPLFLTLAIDAMGRDLGASLARSVGWIYGENQLGVSMIDPRRPFIHRSIQRAERLPRVTRGARMLRAELLGARDALVGPPRVRVNRECRSYHLGWVLYVWGRSPAFQRAIRDHEPPRRRSGGSTSAVVVGAAARSEVLGVPVHAVRLAEVIAACCRAVELRRQIEIGVVNAAKLVRMREDPVLRDSVLNADLIVADGMAVVWAARLLGRALPERVPGIDLFESLLAEANRRALAIYLLGATDAVLGRVVARVHAEFPAIRVAGARNGYFSDADAASVAASVRESGANLLFLGMPSPKKENFIAAWGPRTGCNVIHGVGGSFDVFAGEVTRAPRSWQRLGLEWLFRVLQEPRRLWWRYARTNALFIGLLALALAGRLASGLGLRRILRARWSD
jgi:N-acetylglucosaminyldiphosphoundecaprenol N-acetyl-beta-D-mannosaminyltransferase